MKFKWRGKPQKATEVYNDHDGEKVLVRLYGTLIVVIERNHISLNTGGYPSVTTIRRMNQVSEEYNLGYGVYKRAGRLYVDTGRGPVFPFAYNTDARIKR
jgi:hypothetical protein